MLKDRTLSFEQEPWFKKISEEYPVIQQQLQEVRNKKITNLHLEMVEIGNILRNWYALVEDVRSEITGMNYGFVPRLSGRLF